MTNWWPVHIDSWSAISAELAILSTVITRPIHSFWATRDLALYQTHLTGLWKWFELEKLEPFAIAYVGQPAGTEQGRHVDHGPPHDPYNPKLALNLPVQGCEGTYTALWDHTHQTEQDRYYLTGPVLLSIKCPHSVVNPTDHYRHSISVRFKTDPWLLTDKYPYG